MAPDTHRGIVRLSLGPRNHKSTLLSMNCTFKACDVCQKLANLEKLRTHAVYHVQHRQMHIALKTLRNMSHDRLGSKLPFEVISQIFVLVRGTDKYPPISPLPNDCICAPARLASVCTGWRDVALALPELWTSVRINISRGFRYATQDWLDRSRSMPLHLTIYMNDYDEPDWVSMKPIFSLLRSHSERWEYINIEYAPRNTLGMLFNNLENMPTSELLQLQTGDCVQDLPITPPTHLQPRHLSISMPGVAHKFRFGWENLMHLEMSNNTIEVLLNIISNAARLRHCVCDYLKPVVDRFGNPVPLHIPPVFHHSLEHLELNSIGSAIDLFQHLTLPALRHLRTGFHLYHSSSANSFRFTDVIDFLPRSELDSVSLHTFSLGYHAETYPPLLDTRILELNAVTHLSIDIWNHWFWPVHPLLTKLSDFTVFPELQELRIKLMQSIAMGPPDWAALCDFITKHNLSAGAHPKAEASGRTPTSKINPCTNNATLSEQPHRRSLKSISISMLHPHFQMKMKKDVYLRLRKAQQVGPLKLEVRNAHEDVFQKRKYLRGDGTKDGLVVNFEVV